MGASTPIADTRPTVPRVRPFGPAVLSAVAGSLLIAVSAMVQIPFWPVPLTMQSLVVLVLGAALAPGVSTAAVLLYLAGGLCGLPVFAGGAHGPAALTGATGGFLFGFLLAAPCVGWLVRQGWGRTFGSAALLMLVGHAVLFVPGLAWLVARIGQARAIDLGLSPYLLAIAVKVAVGAGAIRLMPHRRQASLSLNTGDRTAWPPST